jgi:hypothetical protein
MNLGHLDVGLIRSDRSSIGNDQPTFGSLDNDRFGTFLWIRSFDCIDWDISFDGPLMSVRPHESDFTPGWPTRHLRW